VEDEMLEADNGVDVVDQSGAVELNPANALISGLFDGIFEEDDQAEFEPELDLEPEPVTTEGDGEEGSDPDYWF
jgi:hypothetical protein